MQPISRRLFVASTLSLTACAQVRSPSRAATVDAETFRCPPCGCDLDQKSFDAPGRCPACDMILEPSVGHDLGLEPARLTRRAGTFQLPGGTGREEKTLTVHYYWPDACDAASEVLLVIPGAGRNSDDYRNSWLEIARSQNVVVAAIGYPEEHYDFAAYQLGGIAKNLELIEPKFKQTSPNARVLRIADENIRMEPNPDRDEWIFSDFDRVFDFIVGATGSNRKGYDIFGHSAGGQILHRLAVFHPESKARRIIAGNAGFYTLPDINAPPPSGVMGTQLTPEAIDAALASRLTLLLGEVDNSDSAGGTLIHTPTIDRQGLNRLARGHNFYEFGRRLADERGVQFTWTLETVPGVGHDYSAMGEAAGMLLYG